MKKLFFWTVTLLSVIYSCTQKEIEIITPEEPGTELIQLTVRASIGETDGTKTAIQPNKTSIFWTPGDAINLFYGELSAGQFTTSITEPAQSADFNGTLSVATGTTEAGMSARHFWGVYPYNVANSCDGDGVILTIPSAQQGIPNTFADKLNPTVATSAGLDLGFYNVGSWFIFSVTQENVVSATLQGNTNEDIAGTIRVTMDGNSRPVASVQSGAKSITITPQTGDSFVVGEEYYMVLIPQTLSGGYTLTLTKADGSTAQCVKSNEAAFVRSQYRRKSNADDGLIYIKTGNIDFADAAVKTICVNNWDTNGDGELSYTEAAAVTSIPYSTFAENATITSFDEFQYFTGVTSLGYDSHYDEGMDYYGAFYGCTSLTSIILPPALKTISYACFRNCTGLTEITIPASVTTIQQIAFLGCTNLVVHMESATPCTLQKDTYDTYPDPYVFGFLTSGRVKAILVPDSEAETAYKAAEYWPSSLIHTEGWIDPSQIITFKDPITELICVTLWDTDGDDRLSFAEAATVTDLTNNFQSQDIVSFDELKYFTGLTAIAKDTFKNCSKLESISFPASLQTDIDTFVFYGCNKLSTVYVPSFDVWEVVASGLANSNCKKDLYINDVLIKDMVIPEGRTSIKANLCRHLTITSVSIPNSIKTIGGSAFTGSDLASITIPEGVTIHTYAFSGCQSLTSITIPEGTSLGTSVFYSSGLTTVELPNDLSAIPNELFRGCGNLISITIPESVTSIGNMAFYECNNLSSVTIPESVTSIGGGAFEGCSNLESIHLPEGITAIKNDTFRNCSKLSAINLPEGLTTIGRLAFEGCSSLEEIVLPSSISVMWEEKTSGTDQYRYGAFYNSGLKRIECNLSTLSLLYKGLTSWKYKESTKIETIQQIEEFVIHKSTITYQLPNNAFSGYSGLKSVSLPSGMTSIGNNAFAGCCNLTEFPMQATLNSIGDYAFKECSGLTTLTIPANVTNLGSNTFQSTSLSSLIFLPTTPPAGGSAMFNSASVPNIYVPAASVDAYKSAFSSYANKIQAQP